jgi:hypothetical protein
VAQLGGAEAGGARGERVARGVQRVDPGRVAAGAQAQPGGGAAAAAVGDRTAVEADPEARDVRAADRLAPAQEHARDAATGESGAQQAQAGSGGDERPGANLAQGRPGVQRAQVGAADRLAGGDQRRGQLGPGGAIDVPLRVA